MTKLYTANHPANNSPVRTSKNTARENTKLYYTSIKHSQLFALFIFLFLVNTAWGQATVTTQTTTGNYTITIPTGVVSSTVECWGAGGTGTTSLLSYTYTAGGGGGGGSYVKYTSTTIPAGTYKYFVGTSSTTVVPVSNSNSSYFGNTSNDNTAGALVLANGGGAGAIPTVSGSSGAYKALTAGTGGSLTGSVPASGTSGSTMYAGTNGTTPSGGSSSNSGAGGAGAGPSGSTSGGAGGVSVSATAAGKAGAGPGGGGSGASRATSTNSSLFPGGVGADGQVSITYYIVPTITAVSPNSGTSGTNVSITVTGTNFFSGVSTITVDGAVVAPTTYVNSTTLTATINVSTGNHNIGVSNTGTFGTSNSTSTQIFTAIAPGSPTLSATTLTNFGTQCEGGTYGPNMFTITGTNLTTVNVTVAALTGFTYSTTSGGTYTSTLTLSQSGGAYSQNIYVKFSPTSGISYNGNIVVGGGGASNINVAASGIGLAKATPSVSIASIPVASSGTTTVCSGTNVSFSATASNLGGGSVATYQWKLNGANVGTNSNSYSNNTLTTGNTISCEITVSGGCVTATTVSSNTITMAVNPTVTPSVNISITTGSTPTCTGNALTLTAAPTNGGASPTYQWKLNGSNVGSNSTTYSNTNITDGSSVTCVMTSNAACVSPTTATSNTITINNNTPSQPSVISGTFNILPPQSGQTYSVTNVTGVTYTWSYSGTGVTIASGQGTNVITLDFANNATSGTLTVTPSVGVCIGTARTLVINIVPANDECSGAINIIPSSDLTCNAVNGSIAGATQSIAPVTTNTGTSAAPIADVWFKFTATGTNHVVYVNPSSSFDAVVDVRNGACNGTALANADDYSAGGMETVPLSGLTVGADYYVRVYHNKALAGDAAIPADPTFTICVTTPCFYESFTGTTFPPTGWASSSVVRSTSSDDYNTSLGAAIFSSNNGTLTTPSIANPATLKFYLGRSGNNNTKTLTIDVSTTSQSSGFTTIATFDHNNVPVSSYNQYTVDLSSYSSYSTVWIRFSKSSSTTSPWRMDDIAVSCAPVCTPPTNPSGTITALNVLCDGADLHYDQVAAGNIVYYWQNAANGKSTTLGTTDADLDVSTTGNYYVRAYNTSTSCWSTNLVGPTNITIANTTTSIAPLTTQNIATNTNGTTLTVTEGSTVSSRQWKYTTTSGSGYIDLTGQNANTYVPNFASGGVYYVVCESTYPNPCGAVLSKEVKIVVTAPGPPMITHTPLANTSSTTAQTVVATITSSTSLTYCGSAPTLSYRINGGSWVTITGTNSGNTYSFTIPGQPTGTQIEYFISACNIAGTTTSPSNVTQASPYLSFYEYTILCTGGSSTLLAFQGFETTPPTNEWTYSRGCGGSCTNFTVKSKASNYNPNTDNPASSRIRTGSYSYQQTSDGALITTLIFPNVSIPTGATNIKAIVHVASISTTSSNGADGDDYVKVYAGVNGGSFPATADLALFGKSNIRYGFSATGSLTTTAGTPISFTPSAGGYQPTDGTTLLQVNLPDGSTNAALKIELRNNDPSSNEVWVVDDIELWADVPVASGRFYRSKQNGKWDAISTWEVANTVDGTYNQACDIPSFSNSDSIMINTGTTVYITTNHTGNQGIDQTNILTGGKLILGNYNLQINDGKIYSDFNVNGTFEDNTVGSSLSFASGATWSLGSNGVIIKTSSSGPASYRDNYDGDISTIPATASWYYRYKGVGTTNTVAVGMYYPNLYFENAFDNTNYSFSASGSALTGASGGYCTVKGNMDIGTSGTGTVSVYNNNINTQAMKVLGNMTIGTGSTFTNTSYDGTTTSTRGNGTGIELYGNLTNNGTLTNNGNSTGILRFKGTGTQTVSGSGTFNLYNVELDKPTQTLVDQQVNLSTQNNLNFKGGILKTGTNVFSISNATYNTAVTGYEAPYTGATAPSYANDKYVWGRLERTINSSNIYDYPVGDAVAGKGYNPIRFEQKSGAGKATAWFIPGDPGTITAGPTMVGCGGRHFYHYTGMTGEGKWHFESSDNTLFNYNVYLHPNQNNINNHPNDDGVSYPYFYSKNYRTLKKPSDGNNDWSAYAGDGDVCVVGTYYNCPGANYTGFSDFAIPGGDGLSTALPVEIISFTGQCNDDGALLKWETASELNSKEFLLQRSTNGQNYETIAKIAAAGNSNRLLNYSYTDANGAGNHYYRLVEVDINGRENVHTFISVSCDEINSTQVYYSAPKIVLDITSNVNKKIHYSIFEVSGKLIQNEEKQVIRGFNHFELNREQLAKGIYIIQLVEGDKVNAVKVMVQ